MNNPFKKSNLILALSVFLLMMHSFRISAQCNETQVLNSTQNSQLSVLFNNLQSALYAHNLQQIDSLSAAAKIIIGTEAGQPEVSDSYTQLSTNTTWLSTPTAINVSRLLISADSIAYTQTWRMCKGELPPAYQPHSVPLRAGAEISIGLIRIALAETDLARRALYLQWATDGLDSLMTMQLPNGAFPFPDLRTYNDPVYTPIINNYMQSLGNDSVNVLVNGWIIDDSGTGEFKFDAGVIGGAFAEAFMFTGDTNYRNAATKVAAYMDTLRMNTNYNYNSFQTYGLAFGYALNPLRTDWTMNADTILRYSVLPGQIPNGRWMDGHNAKSVYHSIIIHNVSATLMYAPVTNQWQDTLSQMLCGALRNFIAYEDACFASTGFDGLLRAWKLNTTIVPQTLHDSLTNLIGQYINHAVASGGDFLDVYTMGLYLDASSNLTNVPQAPDQNKMNCTVFPNPGSDAITISYSAGENTETRIEILNSIGQCEDVIVAQNHTAENAIVQYDASHLAAGTYFIRVVAGDEVQILRWVRL